jgi:hypothetical protein
MNLEDILRKNDRLKNSHAGKRCFLVGNGPSLKNQDITLLKDEVTIVASSFFRHEHAKTVNPLYWVFADPFFWKDPERFFIPTFNYALEKAVNTKLFVPSGGFEYFAKVNRGPLIDLHFYHYDFSKDITKPIDFSQGIPPYGQNTMTVCLMLALYLGCNPIYFIGCDRDYWNMTEKEYETYSVQHFYDEPDKNMCSYFMPWKQWLSAKARTEWEYEQLKLYAAERGFFIYNATTGGLFNQFGRVQYEQLFVSSVDLLGKGQRLESETDIINVAKHAVKLLNEGSAGPALYLLEAALRININTKNLIAGLEYLTALCHAKMGAYDRAMIYARDDFNRNVGNRENSKKLIEQLEAYI